MMSGSILLALRIALALALYGFLGWALYLLWQDLRRHSKLVISQEAPPLTLLLDGGGPEQVFRFTRLEVMVGRDPASDCRLDDKTISAQHARLSYHHRQWWVEDLQSTNGTYLNEEPVAEPMVITEGDQLRCGQCNLRVSVGEAPVETSTHLDGSLPSRF